MKTLNVAIKGALLAVALLLCACATTTAPNARLQAERSGPAAIDVQKMALIDHIARRKGVDVVWINPPQAPRND